MTNEFKDFVIDEKDLDKRIEKGEISPVHIPKFSNLSEIIKFQFCSEIIKFKKEKGFKQKEIAEMIDVNKSEVSKLFSYNLKEFSQERLISFVEALIDGGAKIDLDNVLNRIKELSKRLEKKTKPQGEFSSKTAVEA